MKKQRGLSNRSGIANYKTLNPGDEIWLYRKGSHGDVVGVYKSVGDIVKSEMIYNGNFSAASVNNALNGLSKSFTSLAHQCRVRPVIKGIADVRQG